MARLCDTIRNTPGLSRSTLSLLYELEQFFPAWKVLNINDIGILKAIAGELEFLQHYAESTAAGPSGVTLPYALNSRIETTGSVLVWGRGCYNAWIVPDGDVEVNGIFRGGRIESRGKVYIREAGSELGVLTRISVPASAQVMMGLAYPGVVVHLGKYTVRFEHAYLNVKIVLGADWKVKVYRTRFSREEASFGEGSPPEGVPLRS